MKEVLLRQGDSTLHGVLERPAAMDNGLAVLVLPGSGPTDRDGNQPGMQNDSLKLLAAGLRGRGITTLRIDKRGIAASRTAAPDEAAMRIETYVADAVSWLGFLRRRPNVRRVALVGHSEGALIATLAAQHSPVAALVLIAGAGRPIGEVLRDQLAPHMPPDMKIRVFTMLATLEAGGTVTDVPPELKALFRPSIQPYMRSWMAYDPAAELAKVTVPVEIIQGRRDLQGTVGDAERLAAAQPKADPHLIDGMNHILKFVPDDRDVNLASYNDPNLPLAPTLLHVLADFLISLP
ncbi:MAG TPA: alpha/beta hydrolase [Terriglobales bacterium]|nr:alpha/beta hydrolase [Terriglobales bacterium]